MVRKINPSSDALRSEDGIPFSSVGFLALGVEPWTFEQKLGEAVFIPAGCPHQVRNLKVLQIFTIVTITIQP
jgi:hypothetical protein